VAKILLAEGNVTFRTLLKLLIETREVGTFAAKLTTVMKLSQKL
jgi:hypothetical protein